MSAGPATSLEDRNMVTSPGELIRAGKSCNTRAYHDDAFARSGRLGLEGNAAGGGSTTELQSRAAIYF